MINKSPVAIALFASLSISTAGYAQSAGEQLVEDIITEVIDQTAEAARAEVRRKTGVDPLDRGYSDRDDYRPAPSDLNEESVNELRRLDRELRIPANVTGHSGDRDRFAHGHHAGVDFVL